MNTALPFGITKAQAESLEAIQRRALRIIDSSTVTTTSIILSSNNSRITFWLMLTQVHPEKWPLNRRVLMPYEVALSLTQFVSLHDRREHLNKKIFNSITIPSSCISPASSLHSETQHYLQITYSITIPQTCNLH